MSKKITEMLEGELGMVFLASKTKEGTRGRL